MPSVAVALLAVTLEWPRAGMGAPVDVHAHEARTDRFERLFVNRYTRDDVQVTEGCYRATLPLGWVEQIEAPALDKLGDLASYHHDVFLPGGPTTGSPDAPVRRLGAERGRGVALLTFDADAAYGCFVACTAPNLEACHARLADVHMAGGGPPPAPTAALRGLRAAILHPQHTAATACVILAGLGCAAIARRPRPPK